jgi:hypothetical protein
MPRKFRISYLIILFFFVCHQTESKINHIAFVGGIRLNTANNLKGSNEINKEEPQKKIPYNYMGSIHTYPIKAYIQYGPAVHSEERGTWEAPLSGYYYYESSKIKIPLSGYCGSNGLVSLYTNHPTIRETFEGEFTESMLEDFHGTWSNGEKSFSFHLKSL